MGFTHESDARRVMAVLPRRLGKYGLAIHPEKTRLIPFHEPAKAACEKDTGSGPPEGTFTFMGFTHYWGRLPQGRWVVKRKTASSRLSRALKSIALWCRANRHRPVKEQQRMLSLKLRGHFAYYGITGNYRSLTRLRFEVVRCWRKWLNRRNRERTLDWNIFNRLLERYPLPPPRVVHSVYYRAASPCSEEPYASKMHVRVCGSPGRITSRGHPAIVECPLFSAPVIISDPTSDQ